MSEEIEPLVKKQEAQPQNQVKDCCCCFCCDCCHCKDNRERSKNKIFCCCCPLSCGIWFMTFFIAGITLNYTFKTIFLFFNQYFDWWYVLIVLLLLVPIWWASIIFITNVNKTTKFDREKMKFGVILAIITVTFVTFWSCIYICAFYQYEFVYHGMGDADDYWNYKKETKRSFVIGEIIVAASLLILLTYFWFATHQWASIADS